MGGLRKYMPSTHKTMLISCIAIAGIPPLAGFFSKDEILANAFAYSKFLWFLGAVTAGLTAFYMFRLYFMTFQGEYRGHSPVVIAEPESEVAGEHLLPGQSHLDLNDAHAGQAHGHDSHGHSHDPHESPASMTGVLWILSILAVVGGWVGIPAVLGGSHPTLFQRWIAPVLLPLGAEHFEFHEAAAAQEWALMLISVAIAALGIWTAFRYYYKDASWSRPRQLATRYRPVYTLLLNKYYVDELYGMTVIGGTLTFSRLLALFDTYVVDGLVNLIRHITVILFGEGSALFDRYVVDGAVNGVGATARGGSTLIRRIQGGMVQNYTLIMGGGIVLLAVVYLFTKA